MTDARPSASTTHDFEAIATALADPTRRAIVEHLGRAPCSVGALAEGLPVSRPAVSQHLAHLGAAGIVLSEAQGTRRIYRLEPDALVAMRDWLDRLWTSALENYAAEAARAANDGRNGDE